MHPRCIGPVCTFSHKRKWPVRFLTQVLTLLQREGRVSYQALKRHFDLDEAYLADLKAEIIQAKKRAVDEDGAVLV